MQDPIAGGFRSKGGRSGHLRYFRRTIRLLGFSFFLALAAQPPATGQSLSGTITDQTTGLPLSGIDTDVFEVSRPSTNLGGGPTDLNGQYTVVLPGPGQYIIRADPVLADGVADEYYQNAFLKSDATPLTVGAGQALTGIDMALAPGVPVSGTITDAVNGAVLGSIDMDIYAWNGAFLANYNAITAVDGTYALGSLPPGTYFVAADPDPAQNQFYLRTFYGGATDIALATPITVGSTGVTNINIALSAAGSIAGVVTDAVTGQPLSGIDIDLFDSLGKRVSANSITDLTGAYDIGPVATGSYYVRVDPTIAQGYARTFYPAAVNIAGATLVSVVAGGRTTGVNVALQEGGAISGTLTDVSTGAPLSGIDLDLFNELGARMDVTTKTDATGFYAIGPVGSGLYTLRADPTLLQGYAMQYYVNALAESMATLISVTGGATTTGIDLALSAGGTISGTVRESGTTTPLDAIDLDCYDSLGNRIDFTTKTGLTGQYTIGPLPSGTYFLRADPTPLQGYAQQYYNGKADINLATPIVVSGGFDTPGIDFYLEGAGTITGTVRDGAGLPVAGMDLDLYDAATGTRFRQGGLTDVNGVYQFSQLSPGLYKVRVDPTLLSGYAMEYFSNKIAKSVADTVAVTANTVTSGIDFTVESGASISGRITDLVSGLSLSGMDMDILVAATLLRLDQSAVTDVGGNYLIGTLPPGQYLVRADPPSGVFYELTYYGQAAAAADATLVGLAGGNAATNVNIALPNASATLREQFHALDTAGNGDGRLSLAEARVALPALTSLKFDSWDGNNDGFLSLDELIASSTGSSGGLAAVWVDGSHMGSEMGTFDLPFNTLEEGELALTPGGTLHMVTGAYAETLRIARPMRVLRSGGPVVVGRP